MAWFQTEEDLRAPVRDWMRNQNLSAVDEVQIGGKIVDVVGTDGGAVKIAVELKLANWRRALYQATIYTSFALESYVAMPLQKKALLAKNLGEFERWNVGILLVGRDGGVERLSPAIPAESYCSKGPAGIGRA